MQHTKTHTLFSVVNHLAITQNSQELCITEDYKYISTQMLSINHFLKFYFKRKKDASLNKLKQLKHCILKL